MKATYWFTVFTVFTACFLGLTTHGLSQEVERKMAFFDLSAIVETTELARSRLPAPPTIKGWYPLDGWIGRITFDEDVDQGEFQNFLNVSRVEEIVSRFIASDSWSNTRNELTIDGDDDLLLVVVQKPQVLTEIRELLVRLEERSQRQILVEVAFVPLDVLAAVAPAWNRPQSSPWLGPDALERILRTAGDRARYHAAAVREGSAVEIRPTTAAVHLVDHEVNQTGVTPVVSSRVQTIRSGAFASVRLLSGPGGDWFRADLRLGQRRLHGEPERRRLPAGDLDLLRSSQEHLATTVAAPYGETAVLGTFSWPQRGGGDAGPTPHSFAMLLRARRAFGEGGPTPVQTEASPAILDAGLLLAPLPNHDVDMTGDEYEDVGISFPDAESRPALVRGALLDRELKGLLSKTSGTPGVYWRGHGSIVVDGSPESTRAVRDRLEQLAQERARLVAVDLWQGVVEENERSSLGSVGALLEDRWLDVFSRDGGIRVRVTGLEGIDLSLGSIASRTYVAHLLMVSGGTGQVVIEAGDPVTRLIGHGLALNLNADLVPGTPWAQLQVDGELARRPKFGNQVRARANQTIRLEKDDKGEYDIKALGEWVTLDLPEEDRDRWKHLVTVPLGRPVLLNALPDRSQPGKTRVLVGVVHQFSIDAAKTRQF